MPDVSQKRLREMLEDCPSCRRECPVNGYQTQMDPPCYPEVQEWHSMAAELLRLRHIVLDMYAVLHDRMLFSTRLLDAYDRCRALLGAEHE